jgi:glycoside/pentoside/hexuronide:cation symporter, GPH family
MITLPKWGDDQMKSNESMNQPVLKEQTVQVKAASPYQTKMGERVSYGMYFVGQNIFYILVLTYLAVLFTDKGIPAATAGVITLIVKVWDAINDSIFGVIVDKVRFKKGKFLPWVRVSVVAIPLATILLFAIPSDIPLMAKIIWATVAYILWDTAYTICDVPIFGIVTTMTSDVKERTTLLSIGRLCAVIAAAIVSVGVPAIRVAIGGWLPLVILLSVIGFITMLPVCFKAKERVEPVGGDKEVSFKQMLDFLKGNKYMLIFYSAFFVSGSTAISTGLGLYFTRHNLGDESLMTLVSVVTLLPMLAVAALLPFLVRKVDKFHLFFWSIALNSVLGFVIYFVGYENFTLYLILTFIRAIPAGFSSIMIFMFTPDCLEYGIYKTKVNAAGVSFALQTFSAKLTAALATSFGAFALSFIGFVSFEGAVQPTGFEDQLWFIMNIIPVAGALLSLPILWQYKLRDKYVSIMSDCNTGKISREEAEVLLAGKI